MPLLLIQFLAAIAAYFVKGLCGFANTLVLTNVLSFHQDNASITPMDILLGYPANLFLTWHNRKLISLKDVLPLAAVSVLGMIPGALLLKYVDPRFLKIVFGLLVIGMSVEALLRKKFAKQRKPQKAVMAAISLCSGLLSGLFGVGALLAAYMSRITQDADQFRGNLCAVFVIMDTFRIVSYAVLGMFTPPILLTTLKLLPAMAGGMFIGVLTSKKINNTLAIQLVNILLLLSGTALIVSNLYSFFA